MNQDSEPNGENEEEAQSGNAAKLNTGRPGQKLRDARKQRGFSVEQIATELGLTEGSVRDIESEQFDRFFGEIYVRGYLRNYAKFLEIDGELIQLAYEQFRKTESKAPETPATKPQKRSTAPSQTFDDRSSPFPRQKPSWIGKLVKIILISILILAVGALAFIYALPLFSSAGS